MKTQLSMIILGLWLCSGCGQTEEVTIFSETDTINGFSSTIKWDDSSFPVIIYAPGVFEVDHQTAFLNAAEEWNLALGVTALQIVFDDSMANRNLASVREISAIQDIPVFKQSNWAILDEGNSTLAITAVFSQGNIIYDAGVVFNYDSQSFNDDSYFWPSTGFSAIPIADFESVLLHELGHVLGMPHVKTEVTTPTTKPLSRL